ncbi:MAG: hypothetical protein HGB36_07465 [Chlorobiaceae bacterium]|nr:hypothetical protein [Chlorobiaceae bacterium]
MKSKLNCLVAVFFLGGMVTVMSACGAKSTDGNSTKASVSEEQKDGRWENVPDVLHGKRVVIAMKYGGWDLVGGKHADERLKAAVESATGQPAVLNRDFIPCYESRLEKMEKSRIFVPYGMAIGYLYETNEGELLRIGPSGNHIRGNLRWETRYFKSGNPN